MDCKSLHPPKQACHSASLPLFATAQRTDTAYNPAHPNYPAGCEMRTSFADARTFDRKERKTRMDRSQSRSAVNRRQFLCAAGGTVAIAAAAGVPAAASALDAAAPGGADQAPHKRKKIPIGVFDPVYEKLSLDEMLDKVSALGLEAMEIGTGGYPGTSHCPVAELLEDPAKAKAWKRKFEDRNIRVATLSCHGNPIHPDVKHAARDVESFRRTVLLAERLQV